MLQRRLHLLQAVSLNMSMMVGIGPFHGMKAYPYGPEQHYPRNDMTRRYRQEYNTRIIEP